MNNVSHSSAVSSSKPRSVTPSGLKRDRCTTIKPGKQIAPTSWRSRPVPIWFLHLCCWQRRFGIATYLLIFGMLVAYSSTVYLQQKWHQEFYKLKSLQLYERQLTTTNEVLKNQLALEAEQLSTGLIPPNPEDAIILQASSSKSDRAFSKPETQLKIDIPSGY